MKKKRNTLKPISPEESREAIKNERFDVMGVVQPDPDDASRLLEQFESYSYIALDDFVKLLVECDGITVQKLMELDSAYVTGVPFEVASKLALSILRIPRVQRDLTQNLNDEVQTDVEMDKLKSHVSAAAKVSREVQAFIERDGAPPSFEKVDRLIRDSVKGGDAGIAGVRKYLEAAREDDPQITLRDGRQLPPIALMPKALLSERKHQVEVIVSGVLDLNHEANVTITQALDAEVVPPALEDLIGKPVRASFAADKRGKVRRALLGAQFTNGRVRFQVEVTRAFRPYEAKFNCLTILRVVSSKELATAVALEASQLQLDLYE